MTLKHLGPLPARLFALAAVVLLLLAPVPLVSGSSKYACDYTNRLCQWDASYMFGATVMGDLAFFNGGVLSNDASVPVNSSALEVLNLRTMSPLVIQVEGNKELMSSRYRHQLVVWKEKILAVGGQLDDSNGASQRILNVIELDLNTRKWQLQKPFTQPGGAVDIVFEASVVVGDQLLVVFTSLPPIDAWDPPTRQFLSLNLNTRLIDHNFYLAMGPVEVLDWPLKGVMTLGKSGDFPHLVVQSKRQLSKVNTQETVWYEVTNIGEYGVEGPLNFTATTHLKELPGGDGGKVLSLTILQVLDQPTLMTWTVTTATFAGGRRETVNAISMYDVSILLEAKGSHSIALKHSKLFLTLPVSMSSFKSLQSVDLPWHGNVAASAADVITLPYVGKVDIIGELDSSNVNIQNWPNRGFVLRGSSLPDPLCQPIANWQPFVLTVDLNSSASTSSPVVRVVSNSTWRSSWQAQQAATAIVGNSFAIEANTKLYTVDTEAGPMLTVMSAQRTTNPGGQLLFPTKELPLQGVFISVANSSVQNFSIPTTPGYQFPTGFASCMANLEGTPMYLEHGGWYYDDAGTAKAEAGSVAVPMQLGKPRQPMLKVGGSNPAKGTVFSTLTCTPDGSVYRFGGLELQRYDKQPVADTDYDGKMDVFMPVPVWAATNQLQVAKLGGSLAAPTLSQLQQLGPAASTNSSASNPSVPNPRSGHTLTYLPPESVASLPGLSKGGLLLYGGSNFSDPSMSTTLNNVTTTMKALSNVTFDRTAWLFDLGSSKWSKLEPDGVSDAPPGLIHHSAAVQGKQLMVWGGLSFVPQNKTMKLSTDMYILDFSESTPRWRKAAVDNINVEGFFHLAFPNTGIAALPESGVVALMHRSGIGLTPIPQSLRLTGSTVVANWGLKLNLTGGDWLRLEIPHNSSLTLQEPLTLGSSTGGVTISGVRPSGRVGNRTTRGLLGMQSPSMPTLECGANTTTAVSFRSSSAILEGLTIMGCNGSAINITTDPTGLYPTPATLRNITIIGNKGNQGSAVHIGPAAAAVLEDCVISHNIASDSTVFADTTSQLTLFSTTISNNNGSGIVFAGSHLNIANSKFLNNTAHISAPSRAANDSLQQSVTFGGSGGALRTLCAGSVVAGPAIVTGCSSNTTIVNSTFKGNTAQRMGGVVYLGAGTLAHLEGNNFSNNAAAEGGAILADRDACLLTLRGSQFRSNNASGRGGAVVMRGASCQLKMLIKDVAFRNNTAGIHGGAMYLDEMINRNIGIEGVTSFMHNKVNVTLQQAVPATATSRALDVGHGGALYLGLWNSKVTISNATFLHNNATGCGGALEIMSIGGDVTLINTTAQNNSAGQKLINPGDRSDSRGQAGYTSEGGAIHVQGNSGRLALARVNISTNQAEKGGGISMDTASGSFSCAHCLFLGNIASLAGGAVFVTERKVVTISNSTFTRNALVRPDSSVGGGFYCYFCEQVNVTRSLFVSNTACYGGGAAIAQAIRPSTIADTVFARNIAYCGGYTGHQGPRSNRALLATTVSSALTAAVGSPAVNVVGDNGVYKGGGGLYVSVQGSVNLKDSCFAGNEAVNGGGLLSRTDVCDSTSASAKHCQLALSDTSILDSNEATGAGDGVLITKVTYPWVSLGNCSMGSELNLTTSMGCLREVNKLCREQGHSNKAGIGQVPSGVPLAAAVDGTLSYMATSAAKLECLVLLNGRWVAEHCSEAVYAAPGMTITVAFRLIDALGKPIISGMYDATMPMEASLFNQDGITQPSVLLLGNNTHAVNGTGYFPALSINGKPGSRYQLVFRTGNGLNLTRQLILRECQAGEHDQVLQVSTDESNACQACTSPQYSFYPLATRCGQCGSLGSERFAVCDSAAVVPANGFYQSHPRSPLLHRCSTAAACSRSKDAEGHMAEWAARHARLNSTQLNQINQQTGQPFYQPYVDHMCAPGYTGPLCGGCSDGHGHSRHRCVQCMSRNANNFCYLLISVFMLLVPALQTFLHSKDVQKRQQHMQQPGLGFVTGVNLSTPQCSLPESLAPVGSGNAAMQKDTSNSADVQMVSVGATNSQHMQVAGPLCSWPDTARQDQDLTIGSNPSGTLGYIRSYTSAEVPGLDQPCTIELPSRSASGSSMSIGPFGAPGHAAIQAAQHTGQQLTPAALGTALIQPAQTSHQPGSSGLVFRLFSTEPLHRTRTLLNGAASTPAQSSTTIHAAKQPTPAPAITGNAPPAIGTIPKFYHSDVLTMLVSYMQLLGLLRLVQLDWSNWDKAVDITLTFLDFTAGVSTWISIECSFADNWPLPKSLKRSLVLILWPVGALLFLGSLWLTCAWIVAHVSRRKHRTRGVTVFQQVQKLQPYMVLSAVTLLYYLYTPTSREIILLFSCQPVDTIKALQHIAPESASTPDAVDALRSLTPTNSSWPGVWASDTSVKCDSAAHMAMAFGLGVPGMVFWVFGLPVALWVLLKRHSRRDEQGRCKLEWPSVELKYGLMYDKYRYRRYYWECVVLLENCVLTMLLVMLQSQPAPLQILVAMTVIFIGVLLHITFRPYAVNLLDTLRRLAVYALMCTLFCMMLVSMAEYKDTPILPLAALIVIAVANVSVLGIHIWAVVSELRRWMRYELSVSNRRLSWNTVWSLLRRVKQQACMPKSGSAV